MFAVQEWDRTVKMKLRAPSERRREAGAAWAAIEKWPAFAANPKLLDGLHRAVRHRRKVGLPSAGSGPDQREKVTSANRRELLQR